MDPVVRAEGESLRQWHAPGTQVSGTPRGSGREVSLESSCRRLLGTFGASMLNPCRSGPTLRRRAVGVRCGSKDRLQLAEVGRLDQVVVEPGFARAVAVG